ncbi:MAG TPA: aldehyde dehydrogenase family protein [Egibacteraceae bacterium]|nr:aldehyde dehydrogenase family protein [Egibacteraceae bacterium]
MTQTIEPAGLVDDAAAIGRLDESFALQRQAFRRQPNPTAAERKEWIEAVGAMMLKNRARIREAVASDFGSHPPLFADLVEMLGVVARAEYAAANVERWMAPERRDINPDTYGTGYAELRREPKGVIGNIVPWNFPFDLSIGPLIDMFAGGNRVIIKPSELSPASGQLLQDMLSETFDRDLVDVVLGDLDLARRFPTLRWDHLMYTGSPGIGKEIAKAAAANLVPVTLELGGKCPAVLTADAVDAKSVSNILGIKTIKNGQMCVTVDYCLVPRDSVQKFVEIAQQQVAETMPNHSSTTDCTGIISERHLDRLLEVHADAVRNSKDVVQLDLEGGLDRETRRMPLSLVVEPAEHARVMQEEVFGPLLPIKPYDSLDEAIDYINDGERPLALYVYSNDEAQAERVLNETSSGGACVNAAAMHSALPALGFGGVGNSGTGRQHGFEGFTEFTNPRGIFVRGEDDAIDAYNAPYGPDKQAAIDEAVRQLGG